MRKVNIARIVETWHCKNTDALFHNLSSESHPFIMETCTFEKGGYIIIDFGKEICGRVHVVFGYNEAGEIRIRTGESVAEACAELGEKNAGNNHSLRDATYPVVGWSDFSTTETGFRFMRIDVAKGERVYVSSIFAEESANGLETRGSFLCSNQRVNDIFEVAKRTISLCVREKEIWDGVKRDRVVWIGDFYPELLSAYTIYGNIPQFEHVLNYVKYFDGHWINNIPAYSAWWIICLEKYFELSGNADYVKHMLPYVDKIVRDFSLIVKEGGEVSYQNSDLILFEGNEFFVDWPTNGKEDSKIGWRYLLIYAMKKAKEVYSFFDKVSPLADLVLKRLNEFEYKPSSFKQITALGVLAGKIDSEEAKIRLKEDGAKGVTAFLSFAIIEALTKLGEGEFALSIIKEYFGDMIDLGATTFWEDFDVDWLKDNPSTLVDTPDTKRKNIHADYGKFCYQGLRHSLCHGWSTGFLDFFYKHILGIVPLEKGYKTIKIDPHLYSLEFVEGRIPTRFGIIAVRHVLKNGKIETIYTLPDGVNKV